MQEPQSIPDILREELQSRKQKNENYSLRSFARNLGLSPSYLSKVIRGERALSLETLQKVASRLRVDEKQMADFLEKKSLKSRDPEFDTIKVEQFRFIADWYHYAILELVTLTDFQSSPKWIAQRLSIPEKTAELALQRLIGFGLLKTNKSGEILSLVANHTSMIPTGPTSAHTEHERQVLEGAKLALDKIAIEHRQQSSMTLAIPISRLPEAKEKIRKFRRELMASLQRPGKRNAVYQISISLYPLTTINQKEIRK